MTPGGLLIMLCVTPLDMRASFDGVARAVKERLGVDAKAQKRCTFLSTGQETR